MPVPLEYLQNLASTFSAVRSGPQEVLPGQPVVVKLVPSSAADLRVTDLLQGALSLTWISKDVRFEDHTIEPAMTADPFDPATIDTLLEGGMPARVPLVGGVGGFENLPGTPGQIAQLAGSFPVAVEVPIHLSVVWEVLDADAATVLAEGSSTFTAPMGTTSPEVAFLFAPQTIELTNTLSIPVTRRFIRATVTLTAGSTTHSFALPNIPVDVPAIPIPTVIVFFRHINFAAVSGDDDGAAFIVVPHNSPLKSAAELQDTLNTLESTLSSLRSVAELAAFLLGLSELTSALSAQPHVQFRVTNASNNFDNFNSVTLISGFLNDIEAEDEMSSLIFIGPTRRQVRCFRDRNRQGSRFLLTIGSALHVIVRSLHSKSPISEPDPALIEVSATQRSFGNELSSLSFP
jgi:hypothetical protein